MKAVNLGGGSWGWRPWGWRVATVIAAAVLMLAVALVLGGCGGDNQQAGTGSQLDDQANGPKFDQDLTPVGGADGGEVLPGYTEDQCIAEMTARYGNEDTARRVCEAVRSEYGGEENPPQLAEILPTVESNLGVTPVPGAPAPGGTGGTTPPGDSGGGTGGTGGDGGWGGIEITVPPAP